VCIVASKDQKIASAIETPERGPVAQYDAPGARQLDRRCVLEVGQGTGDGSIVIPR
jgi:hypothetical protein